MPRYDYSCTTCKREWEAFHTVANRYDENCCGKKANRLITQSTAPVRTDILYDYYSENLDCQITSKGQRIKRMKELGLEESG